MSWFFPNHCVPEGQESRRAVLADSYCEAAVDHSEGCRQPREIQSLAHWLESVPCSSVVGRIPESMRLAQHCRSDTCFTLVVAAPSELLIIWLLKQTASSRGADSVFAQHLVLC